MEAKFGTPTDSNFTITLPLTRPTFQRGAVVKVPSPSSTETLCLVIIPSGAHSKSPRIVTGWPSFTRALAGVSVPL